MVTFTCKCLVSGLVQFNKGTIEISGEQRFFFLFELIYGIYV